MKILYVASYDVSDLKGGNGTDHFKLQALQAAGCEVNRLSPILRSSIDWHRDTRHSQTSANADFDDVVTSQETTP